MRHISHEGRICTHEERSFPMNVTETNSSRRKDSAPAATGVPHGEVLPGHIFEVSLRMTSLDRKAVGLVLEAARTESVKSVRRECRDMTRLVLPGDTILNPRADLGHVPAKRNTPIGIVSPVFPRAEGSARSTGWQPGRLQASRGCHHGRTQARRSRVARSIADRIRLPRRRAGEITEFLVTPRRAGGRGFGTARPPPRAPGRRRRIRPDRRWCGPP